MELAHEKLGHAVKRKVLSILSRSFIWPLMAKNVHTHFNSCSVGERCDKQGHRRVPMVGRVILTEPFESVGIDIIEPLPTGRGDSRYVLTYMYLFCNQVFLSCANA